MSIPSRKADVSVCVPVLNGACFLAECIESVLSASGMNLELIISDNGSCDDSVKLAMRYARDPRVRVIRHDASFGMGNDWNRSVGYATADYVKLLPCDDLLVPGALERERQALQSNPDLSFVFGAKELLTGSGRRLGRIARVRAGRQPGPELRRRMLDSPMNLVGEPGAVMFRKSAFQACAGFDNAIIYYCDVDLWYQLLERGDALCLADASAMFRLHGGALSYRNVRRIQNDFVRLRCKHNPGQRIPWLLLVRLFCTTWIRHMVIHAVHAKDSFGRPI